MNNRTMLPYALISAIALCGASNGFASNSPLHISSNFHWSAHIDSGRTLEIRNINGAIRADHAPGSEVEVSAVRTSRFGSPDDVQIRVMPKDGGYVLCAVYPGDSEDCSHSRHHSRQHEPNVEFTVHLPSHVHLVAKTVNGSVNAQDLRSDVDAGTVNGKIEVSTMGNVRASSVNGSIVASMGRMDLNEPRAFHTVNGSIWLTLPSFTSANLEASTVNGSISSDFPVTLHGRIGRKTISGALGDGGGQLQIHTVNGSIHLGRREIGVV